MKHERFDLVLQMQGKDTIVNDMLKGLSFPSIAGFDCDESYVNSDLFIKYPEGISEIERPLSLMEHLGISLCRIYQEFPVYANDVAEWEEKILPILPDH